MKQLIDSDTRITSTTSTLLDWGYSTDDYISNAGVLNYNISYHLPIFMVQKKTRNNIKKITITGRSYLRYDKEIFQNNLDGCDWGTFDITDDPGEMWDIMEDNIARTLSHMCPIRQLIVPESKPDWLHKDIVLLMRKRDKMYREARRKNDPVLWRKATFLRNRVEMAIKTSKGNKIRQELNLNRNNPKKFWESINSIISNNKSTVTQRLMEQDGTPFYEGQQLAEIINQYFANIGNNLAKEIINCNQIDMYSHLFRGPANNENDNICNKLILEEDIITILKKIRLDKSSAVPDIKTKVIVHALHNQITRVTRMYNGSLTLCTFPVKWKQAIIVPLPKVSNPKTVSDMRPISLLPLPGKILEILISIRFKEYISNYNILTDRQHGFRKKRSTLSAIMEFLHDLYLNLNKNKDTYIVYLDLKKAFDTVSHEILINKLEILGLDQNTILWFKSYLGERSQKTIVDNKCSSELTVSFGVLQGSILGPTLFTVYINDLVDCVDSTINLYADDTFIYNTDPACIQSDLVKISKWCHRNLLTVNCKKSQWMRTRIVDKMAVDQVFKLGNDQLEHVMEYKCLGLNIDLYLNFQSYRDIIMNRINLKRCYFRKIRSLLTQEAALLIYKCTCKSNSEKPSSHFKNMYCHKSNDSQITCIYCTKPVEYFKY